MNENKKVLVAVPASGEGVCREIIIHPGCTVRELKQQLPELEDFAVFKDWDSLPFKENIDLYEKVRDGSKLYAASYQDVG
jgi:hypothetical protein